MILTYLGKKLSLLTDNELLELYNTDNLNSISKTNINLELIKRIPIKTIIG